MNEYWQRLDSRQRRLIVLAAVVVLGALFYVQVWEPLAEARSAERERVAHQQALLEWLRAVAPVAERMREQGGTARSLGDRSLLGVADETARAAGLAGALNRIEPAGEGQVRVWLDGADFVATMGWLQSLSLDYPIEVTRLGVDRGQASGRVNVRLTLETDA